MLSGVDDLKYIGLYNVKINDALTESILGTTNINTKNNLTVCQKDNIITNGNTFHSCCDYWDYNSDILRCDPDNYIVVKFKNEVNYPYGFSHIEYDQSENEYRKEIYLIQYELKRYKPNEALIISKNKEIKIKFNSTFKDISKFFYDYY